MFGVKKEYTKEEQVKIDLVREVMKEIEIEQAKPEYIVKHAEYELMCDKIKLMPMLNLTQIQACKEASRPIPQSVEKVLLFKLLITREDNIKAKYIRYLLKETYYTQEELEAMTHWELQKEYLEEKECNKEDYV